MRRRLWMVYHEHPRDLRPKVSGELQPFPWHARLKIRESGYVSPGMRQACNKALSNGIDDLTENDRNRARRFQQCRNGCRTADQNSVGHLLDQFRRIRLELSYRIVRPTIIDLKILPFNPAQLSKSTSKHCHTCLAFRIATGE